MSELTRALERYFEFESLGAKWRTEILAGFTTYVTMAYIAFVNPSILSEAGMPFTAVVAATCLSASVGSILMGALARYPIGKIFVWLLCSLSASWLASPLEKPSGDKRGRGGNRAKTLATGIRSFAQRSRNFAKRDSSLRQQPS